MIKSKELDTYDTVDALYKQFDLLTNKENFSIEELKELTGLFSTAATNALIELLLEKKIFTKEEFEETKLKHVRALMEFNEKIKSGV